MKRISLIVLMMIGWLAFGRIGTTSAHGLEAGQFSVLLDGVKATISLAPYATAFPFADVNGDGALSVSEINVHQEAIRLAVKENVLLVDQADTAATMLHIDLFLPEDATTGEGDQMSAEFIQIAVRAVWPTEPELVDVSYTLADSAGNSTHYLMKDNQSGDVIEGNFNSAETIVRMRGEGTPTATGSAIWLTGIEHVLSGYDHILFILALVLATAGVRNLFAPLTAFTLAHTVSLAAIAYGYEPPIPSWSIEAAIAASIAILAAIYLLGLKVDVWWVTALLGLVHGLGFGQAMTTSLGSLQEWGSTLIAITVGVELTHLAIALLAFGLLKLIQSARPLQVVTVRRAASIAILCVGLYWTFERIPY